MAVIDMQFLEKGMYTGVWLGMDERHRYACWESG